MAVNQRKLLKAWGIPILILVIWQILAQAGVIPTQILSAPSSVFEAGVKMIANGKLWQHIAISTQRALIGLCIGGSLGFALGLLNGTLTLAEEILDSTIQMIRNISPLSMIPLVILWFGVGESARIFLISLTVFFPIYINTFHGVRHIDPALTEMGRTYGLSGWSMFRHVIFPGALPSILVGLRYALGLMWIALIVAETIAANSGIGYLTMNAREFMQTDVLLFGILLYALLGKLADFITKLLERWLLRWHPSQLKKSGEVRRTSLQSPSPTGAVSDRTILPNLRQPSRE